MADSKGYKNIGFRASPEELEMLDAVCKCENYTPTEFFRCSLYREYQKIKGNPELIEMLNALKSMSDQLEDLNAKLHAAAGTK